MEEGTYQVNLKGQEITDKSDVFSYLEHQDQISEIDLSNNLLTSLPLNLSQYKELQYLDLSNNRFKNYEQISRSLSTLPKLIELKIDLVEQENVLIILNYLPNLMYLNGNSTKLDTQITEEEHLSQHKIEGNKQIYSKNQKPKQDNTPKQVLGKQEPKKDNTSKQVSNKQELKQNREIKPNETNTIVNEKQEQNKQQQQQGVDLEENEIEGDTLDSEIGYFNSIIQKIVLSYKNSKDKTDKFYLDFQYFLKTQIERINNLIDQAVPNFVYSVNVGHAKLEIYGYLRKQIYTILKLQKPGGNNNTSLLSALNEIEDHTIINQKIINDLITKIAPRIQYSMKELKEQKKANESQISSFQNEISALNDKITSLEKTNKENAHTIKSVGIEKETLLNQIKLLRDENSKITNTIIQKAKEIQNTQKQEEDEKTPSDLFFKTNRSGLNVTVGPLSSRVITKKNLLDIIEEIYKSKELYDKKCIESHLAKETLEQHMYTYLNQKYGLKKLIIEWANSIINGIKQYSIEDSEICLFGMILRNELEENIIHVLRKLKSTLKELIIFCIENKYPHKEYNEIVELTNQAMRGYVDEDIWNNVCDLLFNQSKGNDVKVFKQKINDFINTSARSTSSSFYTSMGLNMNNKKYSREEKAVINNIKPENKILYQDFFKLLLNFQIRIRSQYLKNFITVFRLTDKDLNGILNEQQFRDLIHQLNIYSGEEEERSSIDRLLDAIDPYNNNSFTFSEIISTLESIIFIDDNKNKLSALDKIAMNDSLSKQR